MRPNQNITTQLLPELPAPRIWERIASKKRLIALLSIIALIVILASFKLIKIPGITPSNTTQANYVSELDQSNVSAIKKLTTYDWSSFPQIPLPSEKLTLAALLLAYTEESSVFAPEITGVRLTRAEMTDLKLEKLPQDPTKENLVKLIDFEIKIENIYAGKGLVPANTHIARLNILKNYFAKYSPNQNSKIPAETKDISGGIKVADNQKSYAGKLLERFNNWLSFSEL